VSRTQLGPGVWDEGDGALRISVPDILEALGIEPTPANIDAMAERLARQAGELLPLGTPVSVEDP
jgi:hypothetical protein